MNNKVDIILSNTYLSSFYKVLDNIKQHIEKDKSANIILVVPDKFSLNAEQLFFDRLKISSIFNVWLTTLSRLENSVLTNIVNNFNVLNKTSGTMLISKIISQNKDKLYTYKKVSNNYSLAENMYNTINLLKSSGIKPADLKNNIDKSNFGLKLSDIYLIYNEYEKQLSTDYLDAISKFELFDKVAKNSNMINNSHIFFGMFESFTNAQLSTLSQLAKSCKSLTIGLCANTLQNNSYIYDNVVYQRVVDCFREKNINYNITNITEKNTEMQNFLTQNLFAVNSTKTLECNNVKIIECENINQEIRYVASQIKYLLLEKKYKFDDINIAVNGLTDYKLAIYNILNEYGFSYFVDEQRTLLEHYFSNVFLRILDFILGQTHLTDAVSIVKSPIFKIEDDQKDTFANFCIKYNIIGDMFFKKFDFELTEDCAIAEKVRYFVFDNIQWLKNKIAKCNNLSEILFTIREYLIKISAEKNIIELSKTEPDIVEQSINEQVYEKFIDVLDQAEKMLGDNCLSLDYIVDVLKSGLKSVNLSTVPIKCNSIFVGDASSSTYYPRKALFVLGATESRMPKYSTDAGTITDSEIEKFKSKQKITPSIKELNRREKFKLFNLLILPSQNLELTYSTAINGNVERASEFINKLCDIITVDGKKLYINKYNQLPLEYFNNKNDKFVSYLVGTNQQAIKLATSNRQENELVRFMLNNNLQDIIKVNRQNLLVKDKFKIENAKQILFKNGSTKVSQIENYFSCPFKQFINYGLKPKEKSKFEIKSLDVGNILHKVAELFIDYYIENKDNFKDVNSVAIEIFNRVINSESYSNFKNKKYEIQSLQNESISFCNAIKYQIDNSDYIPKFAEYYFKDNTIIKSNLSLSGIVDRIDVCENQSYRVIDYKTGTEEFSYAKAYYGIKLQLIVYMNILQSKLKMRPVGTMYMPIKNSLNKAGKTEYSKYKLDGIFLDNKGDILRMDKLLKTNLKSDIINVSFKQDGEISANSKTHALTNEEFDDIQNYCINILNGAVNEMINGYIEPKPYKIDNNHSSCEFCQYKSICQYDLKNGYRQINNGINKNNFNMEEDNE